MSEDNQEEKMLPVTKSSYNREASGEHHKKQSTSNKPAGRIDPARGFQSSCRSGTICHYRSLLVSIQAFNGATLSLHFPIPTHSYKWFIQSTFKAGRRSVIRAVPLCALIALSRNID